VKAEGMSDDNSHFLSSMEGSSHN